MLESWLSEGDTVLIDVREDFERASESIPGTTHGPLAKLDPDQLRSAHADKRVVFHCRTGVRSKTAAERFAQADSPAFHLAGGIDAWKASGRPCERSSSGPKLDVMRQVQITAGSLVALGVALGAFVSPWLLILPAFIGCGLVFAGTTGWCGMAKALAKMPWNRIKSPTGDRRSSEPRVAG